MRIQDKIRRLFGSLDIQEQKMMLKELKRKSRKPSTKPITMPVTQCPYCASSDFSKNGHRNGQQRYKCKSCTKIFSGKTGTVLHGIKERKKFDKYFKLMNEEYLPIAKMAKIIGISVQTAFDWRHKILCGLKSSPETFDGITEIDDVWFLYSQKGRQGLKYSRKRGGSHRQGDNKFQVKLLITADREKNKDMSVVKIGRITKTDIRKSIGGKFKDTCILVSDKHRSIAAFAKSEKIPHVSFISSTHTAGGEYHVQTVNNIASRMKTIVNHKLRGVSTKYLQNYSNWFNQMDDLGQNRKKIKDVKKEMLQSPAWSVFTQSEQSYKKFIKTRSDRTYRCPVQRKWSTKISRIKQIS
jgi:transposase-like protein